MSRAVRFGLRLLVAGGCLFVAFRAALDGASPAALLDAWEAGPTGALRWLALGFLLTGVGIAVTALRFRLILRAAGTPARYGRVWRAYLVATFFNQVLPGAMLGDAYRVWDARADVGRGSRALGLVLIERLIGLSTLGSLGLVTVPIALAADAHRGLATTLVSVSALFMAFTVAMLHPRSNAALRWAVARLAGLAPGLAASGDRTLEAVTTLSRRPGALLRVFLLSVVAHLLLIVVAATLARPLHADVPFAWYLVIVPFATLISLVPVSIGGAGVREVSYVTLFGAVGMRQDAALALSLSVFAVTLGWAAVGLGVFLAGRRERSA